VVRVFIAGAGDAEFTIACVRTFSCRALSVHPAVNEYPTFLRVGDGEGDEEEEWCPSYRGIKVNSLTPISSHGHWLRGATFTFTFSHT